MSDWLWEKTFHSVWMIWHVYTGQKLEHYFFFIIYINWRIPAARSEQ